MHVTTLHCRPITAWPSCCCLPAYTTTQFVSTGYEHLHQLCHNRAPINLQHLQVYSLKYTLCSHMYVSFTFSRCFCSKWLTVIHTFRQWWLPCKVPTSTSGAAWGLVSCPRRLQHAVQGNQTSNPLITRRWLYPWATAARIICHKSWCWYIEYIWYNADWQTHQVKTVLLCDLTVSVRNRAVENTNPRFVTVGCQT